MDSFTMEIDKEKRDGLDHLHEQDLSNRHDRAALQSEADLAEHEESFDEALDEEDHKHVDYSNYSKSQIVALVKELSKETNFKKVDNVLKEIQFLTEHGNLPITIQRKLLKAKFLTIPICDYDLANAIQKYKKADITHNVSHLLKTLIQYKSNDPE